MNEDKDYKKNSSIRIKILAGFMLMLIPILLLGYISQIITIKGFEEQAINSTTNTINQTVKNIESIKHSVYELYKQLITDSDFRDYLSLDYDELGEYDRYIANTNMVDLIANYSSAALNISSITLFVQDGRFMSPDINTTVVNNIDLVYESSWVNDVLDKKGQLSWGGKHPEMESIKFLYEEYYYNYAMYGAAYVKDYYSDNDCIIIIDISRNAISNVFKDINLGYGSELHLISNDGRDIFLDASNSIVHTSINQTFDDEELLDEVKGFDTKSGYLFTNYNEKEYLLVYEKIKDTEHILLGFIPKEQLLATSYKIKDITLFLIILSSAIIIILGVFILPNNLYKRVNILLNKMRKVENGDMDVTERISGSDEIAVIDHYFNDMVKKLNDLIEDNYIQQIEKREAELDALQFQINPHFLYNTLASINSMASVRGYNEISEITEKLGDMFRYSINSSSAEFVTLKEELEHIKNYIDIENIRFGNKIQIYLDVDYHLNNLKVLKFILQPIVENCIKHGFINLKKTEGFIEVTASIKDKCLYLEICDDGNGMDSLQMKGINDTFIERGKNKKDYKSSIGLKNVNMRIKLAFGDEYGLKINSQKGVGTEVIYKLPYMD